MARSKPSNQLRIIAGRWRGRRLSFPDADGLRPTPDRIRETLFNWLNPTIQGAVCLDLFAGSGALGLEALSRGAGEVIFVEKNPAVARQLQNNLRQLDSRAAVFCTDALIWLQKTGRSISRQFDLVLLDPPFGQQLLNPVIKVLQQNHWLASHAYVYIESERGLSLTLPDQWGLLKAKSAGQIDYRLVQKSVN